MYIQYLGHSCFKLMARDSGETVTVVTDPFGPEYGLRVPSMEADIVTISHDHKDHANVAAIKGRPFVINTAGEFDVKNIFIQGIDAWHDDKEGADRGANIVYRLNIEDVVITHLGDLGHVLDNKQIERLEGTDVLLVPVGGNYTIDAKQAVEVINQIEPRMIIPMHYRKPGLKIELDEVAKFIKEIGIKPLEVEDKYKVTSKELPTEDMQLIIFR